MKKKKLSKPYVPTKMDIKCVKMIRRAARIQLKRGVESSLDDTEMCEMYTKDFMDLLHITDRLLANGPTGASSLVYVLDTGCRETIPETAYNHIMGSY